jgi:hypothetical protein
MDQIKGHAAHLKNKPSDDLDFQVSLTKINALIIYIKI